MYFKFSFETEEEMKKIIEKNKSKHIISINYLALENFIIFSDIPTIEILQQEQGDKISILEAENEILKQELALTQDAVNEMLFMMMNMEVK